MFTIQNIDDTLVRLRQRAAALVGDVVQYEDSYRLCYIRGPEGLLIGPAQELGRQNAGADAKGWDAVIGRLENGSIE